MENQPVDMQKAQADAQVIFYLLSFADLLVVVLVVLVYFISAFYQCFKISYYRKAADFISMLVKWKACFCK